MKNSTKSADNGRIVEY